MKSLKDYIYEAILESKGTMLFKMNTKNAQKAVNLQDALRTFVKHSKSSYSLTNKSDLETMFKDFIKNEKVDISTLKEFNITSGLDIANLLIKNRENLEKDGWEFNKIKTFNDTEREKQYKKWKNSSDYVEGHKLNKKEAEELDKYDGLTRILVIYDVKDPSNEETTIKYDFVGKRGKDTDHQKNMLKVDWTHRTGLKYYDARDILLSNYLKKSDEELQKREITDDIIGKMD